MIKAQEVFDLDNLYCGLIVIWQRGSLQLVGLVGFVKNYLAACEQYPEAAVSVWR